MDPRDLHRIDASGLEDGRVVTVAGDVHQTIHRDPLLDEETINDAIFNVRMFARFINWLVLAGVLAALALVCIPQLRAVIVEALK